MLMSRNDRLLEIAPVCGPRISIEIARVDTASLTARRDASGLVYSLVIEHVDGTPALTLPGPVDALGMIQEALADAMREIPVALGLSSSSDMQVLSWEAV